MKKDDQIGGLIWLVLGIGLSLTSFQLRIGGFHNPGPGFLPFIAGVLLTISGLVLFLSRGSGESKAGKVTGEKTLITKVSRRFSIPFLTLLILLVYILLLEPLGFLLATFFFLFCLFKFVEPRKWVTPLVLSLISVIVSHFVFSVWLRCQFPRGILGF
jgi:putative tricarboxylic transport membrane protein